MKNWMITIGRECGSGGYEVGRRLAKTLGVPCYDRKVFMEIARKTDDYEEVRAFYEEEPVNSLLYAIAMQNSERNLGKVPFQRIRKLCGGQPCVIIGRCGNEIFRGQSNHVGIFLHASLEKRIDRIIDQRKISPLRAKNFVHETDEKRASFHRYYTGEQWGLARNYELCLDSGMLGVEKTVQIILEYLDRR